MAKQNQRPVLCIDQGIIVQEYESLLIAGKAFNRSHANIRQAILKNYKCAGFNWKFKEYEIAGEIWKPHPTVLIECSTEGRLKTKTGKIRVGSKKPSGYRNTTIKGKTYYVSRLIAETFIPNPENKRTVDHINRVRDDNRVVNLRWFTHREQSTNKNK